MSDPSSEVSNLGEKVSNPSQKVSDPDEKVTKLEGKSNRAPLTAKQQKVLEFCDEMPRTAREILRSIRTVETRETLRAKADLNRRTSESSAELARALPSEKEEDAVKAFAGSIRVDEGQLYGSTEGRDDPHRDSP